MRFTKFSSLLVGTLLFISCTKESATEAEEEPQIIATDQTAREAAQKLYEDYYEASKTKPSDIAWSGDEPSCNAGAVPESTMGKIFMRIEYFRKASGLNNVIVENKTKSEKAQQAALMMKSNGTLDHFPPENWKCYSNSGKDGAGNSLLTQTRNAEAVDSYMRDAGAANGPVGHRRWLLWPKLQEVGVGNTDSTNAIWVLGNGGTVPNDAPEFISWPPKGYTPKQFAYPRWSFSIPNADFTGTNITMKDQNNQAVALSIEALDNAYGDRTIVWVPSLNINTITEDATFTVSLKNVSVGEELKDFDYQVILFNSDIQS
jgi:uncharacterized protein YkwD